MICHSLPGLAATAIGCQKLFLLTRPSSCGAACSQGTASEELLKVKLGHRTYRYSSEINRRREIFAARVGAAPILIRHQNCFT